MDKQIFYQEEMKFSYEKESDVQVIRVIRTKLLLAGDGTTKDPYRRVEQYWSLDGKLLWQNDPYKKKKSTGVKGR